jgi:hypothetical protein
MDLPARRDRSPRITADGETWLDPWGKTPVVDEFGKLTEPFIFQMSTNVCEQWQVGMRLPEAPAPYRRWLAELEAKRPKIKPRPGRE